MVGVMGKAVLGQQKQLEKLGSPGAAQEQPRSARRSFGEPTSRETSRVSRIRVRRSRVSSGVEQEQGEQRR